MVCHDCRKHIGAPNAPLAGRVAGTAAKSSSRNEAVDVEIGDINDWHEEQEEPTQKHHGGEFIVRSDGVLEPAPGHGKYRPHRKRGKASRAKSRASYDERWM